jgi:hypothetical protein
MGSGRVNPENQRFLGHIENMLVEVGGLVNVFQKLPSLKDGHQEEVINAGLIVEAKSFVLVLATKKGSVGVIFGRYLSHVPFAIKKYIVLKVGAEHMVITSGEAIWILGPVPEDIDSDKHGLAGIYLSAPFLFPFAC